MAQMDAKDFVRKQDITERSEKIGKMEDNVKYLIRKTTYL